jgi:hypothetical protein
LSIMSIAMPRVFALSDYQKGVRALPVDRTTRTRKGRKAAEFIEQAAYRSGF